MTAATLRRRISTVGPGRSRAARRWNIPGEATGSSQPQLPLYRCIHVALGTGPGGRRREGAGAFKGLLTGAGPLAVRDMAARPSAPHSRHPERLPVVREAPFEHVVADQGPTVYRVVLNVASRRDAEEAWSETFLSALGSGAQSGGGRHPQPLRQDSRVQQPAHGGAEHATGPGRGRRGHPGRRRSAPRQPRLRGVGAPDRGSRKKGP